MKSKEDNEEILEIEKKTNLDLKKDVEKEVPIFIKVVPFLLLFTVVFLLLVFLPPFFRDFFGIEIPWYIIILIWITGIPFKIILRELLEPIFLSKLRYWIKTHFAELKDHMT